MNLDDFVATTLIAVAKGVSTAIEQAKAHGAVVNPQGAQYLDQRGEGYGWMSADRSPRIIKFDVALSVSESDSG